MSTNAGFAKLNLAYSISARRSSALHDTLTKTLNRLADISGSDNSPYTGIFLSTAGDVYESLGDLQRALEYHESSFETEWKKLSEDPDSCEKQAQFVVACGGLGSVYRKLFRNEEAYNVLYHGYEICTGLLTFFPEDSGVLKLAASICFYLFDLHLSHGYLSDAYPYGNLLRNYLAKLLTMSPGDIDARDLQNWAYILLGDYHQLTGGLQLALESYLVAEKGASALVEKYPVYAEFNSTLAAVNERIGNSYFNTKNVDRALVYYNRLKTITESLAKRNPENFLYQQNLLSVKQHFAVVLHTGGSGVDALGELEDCFKLTIRLMGDAPGYVNLKRIFASIYELKARFFEDLNMLESAMTGYLVLYNYLRDMTALYSGDSALKSSFAFARLLFGAFLFNNFKDRDGLKYIKDGLECYNELILQFPTIQEYQRKADLAVSWLKLASPPF